MIHKGLDLLRRLAEIPTVQGMKYTAMNHYELGRFKRHMGSDFMVYSGCDEMILSGLISGADGAIGSTYNVFPDIYRKAVDSLYGGNAAKATEYLLCANDILEIMFRYRLMPAMRAALRYMGVDVGIDRSPFPALSAEAEASLKADLRTYFENHPEGCFSLLAKAVLK